MNQDTDAPTVSLIIRCLNEEAHIGRLLSGVMRQTRQPDEIVVVDSGSTDATLAIASAFPVKVVPIAPQDFSFGRALNVGCAQATGDLLVFASAHVYPVYDTWLAHLVRPFEDPKVGLTYGRQRAAPNGKYSEGRLLAQWFPADSTPRQRHPFCNNANAAIRRSTWETIPYDEDLTGLEDLDWAKRAMDRGWGIAYVAEAEIVHVHDESFRSILNRYRREAIAHKGIYHEQRMSAWDAARLTIANIVSDYRDANREGVLARNVVDIPKFRVAQFYGTYRGFTQQGPVHDLLKRRFYYPGRDGLDSPVDQPNLPGTPIEYDEPSPSIDGRSQRPATRR